MPLTSPHAPGPEGESVPPLERELLDRLLPAPPATAEEIQKRYPPRRLPDGALVTRIAPSPTGFMHLGTLYTALISERLAHQSGGVFFLRIEDTDRKRETPGAARGIVEALEHYQVRPDEGPTLDGDERGDYGPYVQSERGPIYRAFVRTLLESGRAYPCFCTPDELEQLRASQEAGKVRPGYYGPWARWRDAAPEQVREALDAGRPYVIRFRSAGREDDRLTVVDLLKGRREVAGNDQDIVLLKSDGLPTYHLAHVVDDRLMGTTHVLRGDEWFASLPLHLELFAALGWPPPAYGHLAPIQKMDGASKRKLSKRKDPEANLAYYDERGYPEEAVVEYLLNLANSNFEDWRRAHPAAPSAVFALSLDRLAHANGALFDFAKLDDISKDCIARLADIFDPTLCWARKHDARLAGLMETQADYVRRILQIERSGPAARKDIATWSDVLPEIDYFFDPLEVDARGLLADIDPADVGPIVADVVASYDESDSRDEWLAKLRAVAAAHGYAESTKALKAEPEKYRGSIAAVTKILRVYLTGRTNTPDLYEIMRVLGRERVLRRLAGAA